MEGFSGFILRIGKGVIISLLATFALLFVFSIVLTFTNVPENTIKPVITVISVISLLLGSSISTLKIKSKGLINGGLIGLIYILGIYILSSITGGSFNVNIGTLVIMATSIAAGMIGGIIGVNL